MLRRVIAALHRWAESGWAGTATATWEILQSSVVPGPSGAVFAPLAIADPERAPRLAVWATAGAIIGGCIAYLIGAQAFEGLGRSLINDFLPPQAQANMQEKIEMYEWSLGVQYAHKF